mmetsp:Transcript_16996/g.43836  ORF Transcript_16996/g.43836 Transcript_16996/m.43836 type:complete len:252 (+) Transcript_16996:113-868(+)
MAPAQRPVSDKQRRSKVLAVVVGASVCLSAPAFIEGLFGAPRKEAPRAAEAEAPGRRALFAAVGSVAMGSAAGPAGAVLDERIRVAYPPIDRKDKSRCKYIGSAMGQANAARDKLLDLRECQMPGQSAADKDIAGALMIDGNYEKGDYTNTIMSKIIAKNANFKDANFRNAVIDRANFEGADLRGAIFKNTLLTGSTFDGANLEGADFTDSYIDMFGIKPLCKNPTMKGTNPTTGEDTYDSAGCYNQGLAR